MRTATSLLSLALLACDPTPKPDAKANEAPAQTADAAKPKADTPDPTPPAATVEQLAVDPAKSKVVFTVSRAPIGHVGRFEQFAATLSLSDGQPSALSIRVETESVVADRLGLTEHLRSEDFFDVAKYPSASFEARTLTPAPAAKAETDAETGDDAPGFVVVGDMKLHGVERELEFPASFEIEADHVLARATLEISAKAFGIDYEGMEDELAEDEVGLEVELWFARPGE